MPAVVERSRRSPGAAPGAAASTGWSRATSRRVLVIHRSTARRAPSTHGDRSTCRTFPDPTTGRLRCCDGSRAGRWVLATWRRRSAGGTGAGALPGASCSRGPGGELGPPAAGAVPVAVELTAVAGPPGVDRWGGPAGGAARAAPVGATSVGAAGVSAAAPAAAPAGVPGAAPVEVVGRSCSGHGAGTRAVASRSAVVTRNPRATSIATRRATQVRLWPSVGWQPGGRVRTAEEVSSPRVEAVLRPLHGRPACR